MRGNLYLFAKGREQPAIGNYGCTVAVNLGIAVARRSRCYPIFLRWNLVARLKDEGDNETGEEAHGEMWFSKMISLTNIFNDMMWRW